MRTAHVVELFVDLGQKIFEFVRFMLFRELRHDPCGTGKKRRVGQERPRPVLDLEPLADRTRIPQHRMADTSRLGLHQPELFDKLCGLLCQLHVPT